MDIPEANVKESRQLFKRTRLVCLFTCIFMFMCCVYCTILLHAMHELSKTCVPRGISDDTDASAAVIQTLQSSLKDAESSDNVHVNQMRLRRSTQTDKPAKRKKPRKKKPKMKAGHYESITSPEFLEDKFPPYDDGNLTNTDNVIRAFKAAPWVSEKNSPFSLKDKGFFTAKYSGVHLIYSQVLFYDNKEAQILRLVQMRKDRHGVKEIQALTCHESVNKTGPVRYHSCGITGLYALKKGDVIYLQNVFGDVKLNLRISTTYIGAILLK